MSKGSVRRPGEGYSAGYDRIFQKPCSHEWRQTGVFLTIPGAWEMRCDLCGKTGQQKSHETEVTER